MKNKWSIENCIMRKDIFLKQRTYLLLFIIPNLYVQLFHAKFVIKKLRAIFSLLYQTCQFQLPQVFKSLQQHKLPHVLKFCRHLASIGFANTINENSTLVSINKIHFSI
jgi:hypothetical protein